MENNLAIQELAAINEIDLGLKKLKEIFKSKEPYQPIDTTEGEFNYCVDLDNGRDKCQEQCDYCVQRQVVLSQKQAPIETEQRYKVFAGENNGNFEVQILGIESAEQAIKVRKAIKQYLSTNKF